MNIIKKNMLADKEQNMLTAIEVTFVQNAIALLAVEDVVVNNKTLEEIYDCEGFFNRHQKRIGAVLDVLRGLFAIGFTDEQMLAKFKTFHWENEEGGKERLASMMKAFSENPEDVDAAAKEMLERILVTGKDPELVAAMCEINKKLEEHPLDACSKKGLHWSNGNEDFDWVTKLAHTAMFVLCGFGYALRDFFEDLDFDTFKAMDLMGLNKRLREGFDARLDKNMNFRMEWLSTKNHPDYNNLYADKCHRLILKLYAIETPEQFDKVKAIVEEQQIVSAGYLIESNDEFDLVVNDDVFEQIASRIESIYFTAAADALRNTDRFEEAYPLFTNFFEDNEEKIKAQGFTEEFNKMLTWTLTQVAHVYSSHGAFLHHYDFKGEGSAKDAIGTNASKKVTNFFKDLTEEEKQMVRRGELLGEYRVENFSRGEYVEQTA